jgi:XTP/dITP diphosphohydrolase
MMKDLPYNVISLIGFPEIRIKENGLSFVQNSVIKAKTTALGTGFLALGDDSGLEVAALDGEPGIYTARYAGSGATDEQNIKKLLYRLRDVPAGFRQARFVCSLCLAFPDGSVVVEQGYLEGEIAFELRGAHGFGYDPIFYLPSYGKTLAEISEEQKNRISHRAAAFEKIKKYL